MDISSAKFIELTDKQLFDTYFKRYEPEISEFTFTNLFMWRNYYEFQFIEVENHLIIFSKSFLGSRDLTLSGKRNSIFFLPPIGPNPSEKIITLFETIDNAEIHRVPEKIVEEMSNNNILNEMNIEIYEDRANWDYVYEVEDLKTLPGNRYRQNRRWLNKFLENYEYEFKLLNEELIDLSKKLQLEWCIMRGCEEDKSLEEEQKAIYEALDNFDTLKFSGGIICIEDKCAAYTFGEILNSNTMVIHIEKANMKYEGAYQAINNFFVNNCCENAVFVNREQDLGIPGLRRAKESYQPSHMVEKSVLYRKP
ncbi:MAG: DUF2156 domain-containing protein, partial [Promethearchaeota archaeon]